MYHVYECPHKGRSSVSLAVSVETPERSKLTDGGGASRGVSQGDWACLVGGGCIERVLPSGTRGRCCKFAGFHPQPLGDLVVY